MTEPHHEILDLLYKALGLLKKLPFQEYNAPAVVGAMVNIETTIESLENNAKREEPLN